MNFALLLFGINQRKHLGNKIKLAGRFKKKRIKLAARFLGKKIQLAARFSEEKKILRWKTCKYC